MEHSPSPELTPNAAGLNGMGGFPTPEAPHPGYQGPVAEGMDLALYSPPVPTEGHVSLAESVDFRPDDGIVDAVLVDDEGNEIMDSYIPSAGKNVVSAEPPAHAVLGGERVDRALVPAPSRSVERKGGALKDQVTLLVGLGLLATRASILNNGGGPTPPNPFDVRRALDREAAERLRQGLPMRPIDQQLVALDNARHEALYGYQDLTYTKPSDTQKVQYKLKDGVGLAFDRYGNVMTENGKPLTGPIDKVVIDRTTGSPFIDYTNPHGRASTMDVEKTLWKKEHPFKRTPWQGVKARIAKVAGGRQAPMKLERGDPRRKGIHEPADQMTRPQRGGKNLTQDRPQKRRY